VVRVLVAVARVVIHSVVHRAHRVRHILRAEEAEARFDSSRIDGRGKCDGYGQIETHVCRVIRREELCEVILFERRFDIGPVVAASEDGDNEYHDHGCDQHFECVHGILLGNG